MTRINRPKGRSNRKQRLVQYGTHLVYAEGKKTEPLYVENIKKILNKKDDFKNSNINIEIVDSSGGRETLRLISYAEHDIKNRLKNGEKIDYVWIFYDKDDFKKDDFDNAYNKVQSKNKTENQSFHTDNIPCDSNGIHYSACWSNECFEIWGVLHFQYLNNQCDRKRYIEIINKHIDNENEKYHKNRVDLYDILSKYGDVNLAIINAKKLDNLENVKSNPSTGVYLFVEHFKKYLDI